MKKQILIKRNYSGEEIGDIDSDVSWAIESSQMMADDTDEHGFAGGYVKVSIEYIPAGEDEPCKSFVGAGPGHQSHIECEETGTHTIHRAFYDYGGYEMYWKGDNAYTGYFDEAPNNDLEAEYWEEQSKLMK